MSEDEKKTEEKTTPEEVVTETATEATEPKADAPVEDAAEAPTEEVTEEVVEELPHREVKPGMVVRVHETIKDVNARGEAKTRVQVFEGTVIGIKNPGVSRMMTVRKNSKGFIVEKIYPLSSPNIDKIEVVKQFKVRRAKLSYLRDVFKRKMKEVK